MQTRKQIISETIDMLLEATRTREVQRIRKFNAGLAPLDISGAAKRIEDYGNVPIDYWTTRHLDPRTSATPTEFIKAAIRTMELARRGSFTRMQAAKSLRNLRNIGRKDLAQERMDIASGRTGIRRHRETGLRR